MQKQIAHWIFSVIIFLYRSSGGRIGGRMRGMDVLLLTTTGRKSGKPWTVPLIYMLDDSAYVVTASAGGSARHPAWFLNVRSNPQASIDVKDRHLNVVAQVAGPEDKRRLWTQLLSVAPFFADYQKRTSRDIPMVILRPAADESGGMR